jgi:hypothetical protein
VLLAGVQSAERVLHQVLGSPPLTEHHDRQADQASYVNWCSAATAASAPPAQSCDGAVLALAAHC